MKTQKPKTNKTKTDWGDVANWYDDLIKDNDSYQTKVVLPNLVRILGGEKEIKNKSILDLACGSGFFSNILSEMGANVIGIDLGNDLIKTAKDNSLKLNLKNIKYFVGNAENFTNISDIKNLIKEEKNKFDSVICILAIQNINKADLVLKEIKKVLKQDGKAIFIINHPSFRIPKFSDWYFDEKKNTQNRTVAKYMSEIKSEIDMNPGERDLKKKKYTISFHRPLQYYTKLFVNNGFLISKIEEWISHKESEQTAKRKKEEDIARHEIPMFMCIEILNK
jgi:ubiquinone/menaquinone biosynthesis C-methylase UbiE